MNMVDPNAEQEQDKIEIRQCYHLKHQDPDQEYIGTLDHQAKPFFACVRKCAISTLRSAMSGVLINDLSANIFLPDEESARSLIHGLLLSNFALAHNCEDEPKPKKHAFTKSNTIIWQQVKETR
jgi:hypothetical protein